MQTDATTHSIVACCWGFWANNVGSVYMGLLERRKSCVRKLKILKFFMGGGGGEWACAYDAY